MGHFDDLVPKWSFLNMKNRISGLIFEEIEKIFQNLCGCFFLCLFLKRFVCFFPEREFKYKQNQIFGLTKSLQDSGGAGYILPRLISAENFAQQFF